MFIWCYNVIKLWVFCRAVRCTYVKLKSTSSSATQMSFVLHSFLKGTCNTFLFMSHLEIQSRTEDLHTVPLEQCRSFMGYMTMWFQASANRTILECFPEMMWLTHDKLPPLFTASWPAGHETSEGYLHSSSNTARKSTSQLRVRRLYNYWVDWNVFIT